MNKKEEIFTIGDKTNNGTISKFEVDSNGIRVFFEEKPKNYHVSLNSIKHIKQPLFTTEDGVDIFEDDKCFGVDINCYEWIEFKKSSKNINLEIWKTFSTKEKAEEYIIMNKPCLSLKDIDELLCKNTSSYFLEKFKKLAQQRLNK